MNERYIFKFATKKAGCKGPDLYYGDVIWDESDGPTHLKFWSGKEYVRLSDMVRNEVDKYMKEINSYETESTKT